MERVTRRPAVVRLEALWPAGVPRPRSMRYRVLLVVVTVVVLPLLWVWISGSIERGDEQVQQRLLASAAERIARALEAGESLGPIAAVNGLHVRVIEPSGVVAIDIDEANERPSLLGPMSSPFYGPTGPPTLATADANAPPLLERTEVVRSRYGPQERCEIGERGLILVCSAALRLEDGRIVHVMRGTPRLVRSLYEERFQLAALTLGVLIFGIGLALWLGWRIVSPIEQLRDQVVARTRGPFTADPVQLDRQDEIGDLAAAFNALLRAIDERNRSNTSFAADLAHELKNPVAAVRAAAEALGADRPVEGERLVRLQRVLSDASRRMESVVHQFLELARAEAGLPGVVREELDLSGMVEHLLEPVRVDDRFRHLEITFKGQPALVNGVAERLETAVRNLLSNAAAFAAQRVDVSVAAITGGAVLTVTDDGPGIAPEEVAELFTRYRTRRDGGTGLGLAMTKAIIEAHGGAIEVTTEVGSGASFRIELPAAS